MPLSNISNSQVIDTSTDVSLDKSRKSGWDIFCQTAAMRLAVVLPFAVAVSNSAVDVVTLLLLLFWLLSGHWKERIAAIKTSPILLASLPLTLWTLLSIFRSENSFFNSLRYWNGHYPYLYIIVLAAFLSTKEKCYAMISSVNLAILLTWGCAVYVSCAEFLPEAFRITRGESFYLYRNTICFGNALVLWSGLWVCVPYTSRHIPIVRRLLPVFLINAMETASKISLYELLCTIIFSEKRLDFASLFLTVLRWGTVIFVLYYLFFVNPSRTAQIAFLLAFSSLFLTWNWRYGILYSIIFLIGTISVSSIFSNHFREKIDVFNQEISQVDSYRTGEISQQDFTKSAYFMRAGTYLLLLPDITQNLIFGYGLENGPKLVKERTGYVDPHCEFLYIIIQHGLTGLICFLLWMGILFYQMFKFNNPWNRLGVFIMIVLFIACFFNCALSYHCETFIFIVLLAVLSRIADIQYREIQSVTNIK